MIFASVFALLFLHEVFSLPLYRRLPKGKFANISQEAFKKLDSASWKGSELSVRDYPSGEVLELLKERKATRDPTELDLNATKLKELLAESFDAQLMSETEPSRAWPGLENELDRRSKFEAFKHDKGVEDSIKKLLDRKRIHLNEVEFEDIRFWIWNLTRCTVEPFWKDFGARIWPRFLNVGKCSNKMTCSLPSGMKCQPSEKKTVRLLYWICPKGLQRCFWSASFETKVVRACSCSC